MTRFEESAIRNSVAEHTPATLPYWHPSSQFSSLIDPHESNDELFQYQPLASEQMPPPSRLCNDGQSDTYSQYGNFAHLAQELDRDHSSTPQYSPSVAVKVFWTSSPETLRAPCYDGSGQMLMYSRHLLVLERCEDLVWQALRPWCADATAVTGLLVAGCVISSSKMPRR